MHLSSITSMLSTKALMSFSAEQLYSRPALVCTGASGCCSPGAGFGIFLCKPSWNSAQVHFFQPIFCTTLSFISSANLQKVHSALSPRSLIKVFSSIGPSTNPRWTPQDTSLLTYFQMDFLPLSEHHALCLWTNPTCTLTTWLCRHHSKSLTKDKHQLFSLHPLSESGSDMNRSAVVIEKVEK